MVQRSKVAWHALVLVTAAAGLALAGCSVNADGSLTVGNHASSKVSSKADGSTTSEASSTDSSSTDNGHSANSSTDSSSTDSTQYPAGSPMAAVAALAQRGLTGDDLTEVDVETLPGAVKATDGVSFHSASDFRLTLLKFATGSDCQAARTYYARANQKVYATGTLLLIGDRGLSQGWFEKYQRAIFRQ